MGSQVPDLGTVWNVFRDYMTTPSRHGMVARLCICMFALCLVHIFQLAGEVVELDTTWRYQSFVVNTMTALLESAVLPLHVFLLTNGTPRFIVSMAIASCHGVCCVVRASALVYRLATGPYPLVFMSLTIPNYLMGTVVSYALVATYARSVPAL